MTPLLKYIIICMSIGDFIKFTSTGRDVYSSDGLNSVVTTSIPTSLCLQLWICTRGSGVFSLFITLKMRSAVNTETGYEKPMF